MTTCPGGTTLLKGPERQEVIFARALILGFHADNSSEYINHRVASLLEKLRIELTKSRARQSNDNALVESKNGSIVRKHLGYAHIASRFGYRAHPEIERAVLEPATVPAVELARLSVDIVDTKPDSLLWNAHIQRYHYLGHRLLPGAQLRYFVRTAGHIIALLGFGASAWKTKPRDEFIGWTSAQRSRNLHLIVNNARFLIPPWVRCPNLASRILALTSRRLPQDWHARYAYRPVLLETFVEKPRFAGTCYRAANWQYLGDTQGRGKLDQCHRNAKPIKSIWVYPFSTDFRPHLCNA
jgi:hypothetical protein